MNIEKLYIKNAQLIDKLILEADSIKMKFGSESKIYKSKNEQIDHMQMFHDQTIDYIIRLKQAHDSARVLNMFSNLALHTRESDIPISEALKSLRLPSTKEILEHS